jgi:hypothetical protein
MLSGGSASVTASALSVATHTITATYGGDSTFQGSKGGTSETVTADPTAAAVSAPAVTYGADGTVTVTISSAYGTPTGFVSLSVDGGAAMTATLAGGSAAFSVVGPAPGDHSLAVTYAAQGNIAGSSAAGTLHVNPASADVELQLGQATALNPNTVTASGFDANGNPTDGSFEFDGSLGDISVSFNNSGLHVSGNPSLTTAADQVVGLGAAVGSVGSATASALTADLQAALPPGVNPPPLGLLDFQVTTSTARARRPWYSRCRAAWTSTTTGSSDTKRWYRSSTFSRNNMIPCPTPPTALKINPAIAHDSPLPQGCPFLEC